MKKWSGYRSEISQEKFDTIIIGSGISGLTTAVLLSQHGQRVLVLEKHLRLAALPTHLNEKIMNGMWVFII